MRCGHYRNHILGQVDTHRKAFLVDIREMVCHLAGILVRNIEVHELLARNLQFVVDAAGYDVARRERAHRVVFVHELLAVLQPQDAAETAHRLADQE